MERTFNIIDVIDLDGIPHVGKNTNPNEIKIECPYCKDSRGKATVKVIKDGKEANVFHCWSCNKTGNMTTLHYDVKGCFADYKAAYRDLCEKLQGKKYDAIQKETLSVVNVAKRASVKVLDKTYRQMLTFIRLKQQDKEDLLHRGLTEEEIKGGLFRSTPTDNLGICRKLLKAGCVLEGVPGFFKDRTGAWKLNVYRDEGYFCPVFQGDMIVGMQIRLSNPKTSCKYIWLSSSDKEMGTPSGTPASFFGDINAPMVFVTEGILKSYVTHCMWPEAAIIGVPGVSAIGSLRPMLKAHHHNTLIEVYDMDKRESVTCRQDYKVKTCEECRDQNGLHFVDGRCQKKMNKIIMLNQAVDNLKKIAAECHMTFKSLYWDKTQNGVWRGNYKGIDDYLAVTKRGVTK